MMMTGIYVALDGVRKRNQSVGNAPGRDVQKGARNEFRAIQRK